MFAGYRGSTTMSININRTSNVQDIGNLSATRYYNTIVVNSAKNSRTKTTEFTSNNNESSIPRLALIVGNGTTAPAVPSGTTGTSLTNPNTLGGLNVSLPQYSNQRLMAAYSTRRNYDYATDTWFNDNVSISGNFITNAAASSTVTWPLIDVYYGAGVDFNPVFFVAAPVCLIWDAVPTAANGIRP
jgi:hypothetical protein